MIRTPDYIKRYSSAKVRFLKGILYEYFKNELSRFLGPILLDKFIDGLLQRLEDNLPLQDYVKSGQIVWNVVDSTTRADSKNTKYIPVTLTLICERDIEKLEKGIAMSTIR
ncbi:MAG: DUF1670 domain-containing protein, partial [Chlamydiia bacterium]|nr:DUF1670 domain-containing protein [Chlamydiia bacterium]